MTDEELDEKASELTEEFITRARSIRCSTAQYAELLECIIEGMTEELEAADA